jgi:hypothetical protein
MVSVARHCHNGSYQATQGPSLRGDVHLLKPQLQSKNLQGRQNNEMGQLNRAVKRAYEAVRLSRSLNQTSWPKLKCAICTISRTIPCTNGLLALLALIAKSAQQTTCARNVRSSANLTRGQTFRNFASRTFPELCFSSVTPPHG